jgi:hypothetical protein
MVEIDILKHLQESKLATDDISPQIFDKIAEHIEKEEMDSAVALIQDAFGEGNFDMRLVSYYFYDDFVKSGVKSFKETLPIFMGLVKDHWEALRPLHRKDKQIESSFNWFFTQVVNKLKYNERLYKENKAPLWSPDILRMSQQDFGQLQETLKSFYDFFHERWEKSSAKERVGHLLKRIADLKPMLVEKPEVAEEPVVEEVAPPEETVIEAPPVRSFDTSMFETPEMMNLIKKLKTFETLAEKGKFRKAALVSTDISQAISNFDPCFYFPKLFSTYFNLLARHSSSIAEESENQEALEWKALERLYRTDLDQFTKW